MRSFVSLSVILALSLPALLPAEVVIRPHEPDVAERATKRSPSARAEKYDPARNRIILPTFEVDTTNPNGTTTLFAVRNISAEAFDLVLQYYDLSGELQRQDVTPLAAGNTRSLNLRDVSGLAAAADGIARGFVIAEVAGAEPFDEDKLVGDFFQVDVGDNFATGDRMFSTLDVLCDLQEIRFLDFGSGTKLRLWILIPQGANPATDQPSLTVTAVDETGNALATNDIFTDQFSLTLTADAFTAGQSFGTLIFDFAESLGGYLYAEYSAGGRFSVGLNGACVDGF